MTVTFDLESMAEELQATSPPEMEMDDVGAECEIGAGYASVDSPSVALIDSLTKRSQQREEHCISPYSGRSSPPEKLSGTPTVDRTNDLLSQGLDAYDEPPCDEGVIVDGLVNLTPMGDNGHHDSTGESYYSDSILDSTRESEGEDLPSITLVPAAVLLQEDGSNDALDLSTSNGESNHKTRPANIGVCTYSDSSCECDNVKIDNDENVSIKKVHTDNNLYVPCDTTIKDKTEKIQPKSDTHSVELNSDHPVQISNCVSDIECDISTPGTDRVPCMEDTSYSKNKFQKNADFEISPKELTSCDTKQDIFTKESTTSDFIDGVLQNTRDGIPDDPGGTESLELHSTNQLNNESTDFQSTNNTSSSSVCDVVMSRNTSSHCLDMKRSGVDKEKTSCKDKSVRHSNNVDEATCDKHIPESKTLPAPTEDIVRDCVHSAVPGKGSIHQVEKETSESKLLSNNADCGDVDHASSGQGVDEVKSPNGTVDVMKLVTCTSTIKEPQSPSKSPVSSSTAEDPSAGDNMVAIPNNESCTPMLISSTLPLSDVNTTGLVKPNSSSPETVTETANAPSIGPLATNNKPCYAHSQSARNSMSPSVDNTTITKSVTACVSAMCSEVVEETLVSHNTMARSCTPGTSVRSPIKELTSSATFQSSTGIKGSNENQVASNGDICNSCTNSPRITVNDNILCVSTPSKYSCSPTVDATVPSSDFGASEYQRTESNTCSISTSTVSNTVAPTTSPLISSMNSPTQETYSDHFPVVIGASPKSEIFVPPGDSPYPRIISITPCPPSGSPTAKCISTASADMSPVASRKSDVDEKNRQINSTIFAAAAKLSPIPKPVPSYPVLQTSAEFTLPDLYNINPAQPAGKHRRETHSKSHGIPSDINRNFKYLQKLSDEAVAEKTLNLGFNKRGRGRRPKSQQTSLGFSTKNFAARKMRKPGFNDLLKDQSASDESSERLGNANDAIALRDKAGDILSKMEIVSDNAKKVKTHSSDCSLSLREQMVRTAIEAKHVYEHPNKSQVEENSLACVSPKPNLKFSKEPEHGPLKLMIKLQNNKHSGQKREYFVQRKCTLNVKYDESAEGCNPEVNESNRSPEMMPEHQIQEYIDSQNDTLKHKYQQHSIAAKVHNQRLVRFVVHGGRCVLMSSSSSTFKQRSRLSMLKTQVPVDMSKKQFLQEIFHSRPIVKLERLKRKRSKSELLHKQFNKYGRSISRLNQKTFHNGSGRISKVHLNDGIHHHRKPIIAFPSVFPGTSNLSGTQDQIHGTTMDTQSCEDHTVGNFESLSSKMNSTGVQYFNCTEVGRNLTDAHRIYTHSNCISKNTISTINCYQDQVIQPTSTKMSSENRTVNNFFSGQDEDSSSLTCPLGGRINLDDASPIHLEDVPPKLTDMRETGESSQSASDEDVTHISPVMPILDKECSLSSPGSPDMTVTSKRFPVVVLHKFDNSKKASYNANANKRKLLFDTFAQELSVGRRDAIEIIHSSPKPKKQRAMHDVFGLLEEASPSSFPGKVPDDSLYRYKPIYGYKPSYETTLLPPDSATAVREVLDEIVSYVQQQEETDARAANGETPQGSDSMQLVIGNVVSLQGQDTNHLWDSPLPSRRYYTSTSEYEYEHSGDSCDSFLLQGRKRFSLSHQNKSTDDNRVDITAKCVTPSKLQIQSDARDRKSRLESMCDKTVKTLKLRLKPLQLPSRIKLSSAIPTKPCSVVLENTCIKTVKLGSVAANMGKESMDNVSECTSSPLTDPVVQPSPAIKRTHTIREKKRKKKGKDTRPFVKSGTLLYKRRHGRRRRKRRMPDTIRTISERPKRKTTRKKRVCESPKYEDNDELPTIEPLKKKPRLVSLLGLHTIDQYSTRCVMENNQPVPIIPLESRYYSTNEDQQETVDVSQECDDDQMASASIAPVVDSLAMSKPQVDVGTASPRGNNSTVNIGLGEEPHKAEYTPESGYKTRDDEGNSAPEAADDSQSSTGQPEGAHQPQIQSPEGTGNQYEGAIVLSSGEDIGVKSFADGITVDAECQMHDKTPLVETAHTDKNDILVTSNGDCIKEGPISRKVVSDLHLYGQSLSSPNSQNEGVSSTNGNAIETRVVNNIICDLPVDESLCVTITETSSKSTEEASTARRINHQAEWEKIPELQSPPEGHSKIIDFAEKTAVAILKNIEHDLDSAQESNLPNRSNSAMQTSLLESGNTSQHGSKLEASRISHIGSSQENDTCMQTTTSEHYDENQSELPFDANDESNDSDHSVNATPYRVTSPQNVLSPLKSPAAPSKDEPSDMRPPATPGPDILNDWEAQNTPCIIEDYSIRSPESTFDFSGQWQSPATPCMDEITVCNTPLIIPSSPMYYNPRDSTRTPSEAEKKEGESETTNPVSNDVSEDQKVPTQVDEAEAACLSPSNSQSPICVDSQNVTESKIASPERCLSPLKSIEHSRNDSIIHTSNIPANQQSADNGATSEASESASCSGNTCAGFTKTEGINDDHHGNSLKLKLDVHSVYSNISPPQLPKDILTKSSPIEGPTGLATLANVASLVIHGKPKKQSRHEVNSPQNDIQSIVTSTASHEPSCSEGSRRSSRDETSGSTTGKPNWTVRRGSKSNSIVIRKVGESPSATSEESKHPFVYSPIGSVDDKDNTYKSCQGASKESEQKQDSRKLSNDPVHTLSIALNREEDEVSSSSQNFGNQGTNDIQDAKKDTISVETPYSTTPTFNHTLSMPTDFDDPRQSPTNSVDEKRGPVKVAGVDIQMELALSDDASSSSDEYLDDDIDSSYQPSNDAEISKDVDPSMDEPSKDDKLSEEEKQDVGQLVAGVKQDEVDNTSSSAETQGDDRFTEKCSPQVPPEPELVAYNSIRPSEIDSEKNAPLLCEIPVQALMEPCNETTSDYRGAGEAGAITEDPYVTTSPANLLPDAVTTETRSHVTGTSTTVSGVCEIVLDVLSSVMTGQSMQDTKKTDDHKEHDELATEADGVTPEQELETAESPEPNSEEALDNAIRSIGLHMGKEVEADMASEEDKEPGSETLPVQTVTILNSTPSESREMDGEICLAVQKIAAECSQMELNDSAPTVEATEPGKKLNDSSQRINIPPSPIHPTSPPAPEPPVTTNVDQSQKASGSSDTSIQKNESLTLDSFAPPKFVVPPCMQAILDKTESRRDDYNKMDEAQLEIQDDMCKNDIKKIQNWIDAFEKMKIPFLTKRDQLRQSLQWVRFARARNVECLRPRKYALRKKKPKAEKKALNKLYVKEHKLSEMKKSVASKSLTAKPNATISTGSQMGTVTKSDPPILKKIDNKFNANKHTTFGKTSLQHPHNSNPKQPILSCGSGGPIQVHSTVTERTSVVHHPHRAQGIEHHSMAGAVAQPPMTLISAADVAHMTQTSANWPHVVSITPVGQENIHDDVSHNVNRDKTPMVPVSCMVSMPSMSGNYHVIPGHSMMVSHPSTSQSGSSDGNIMTSIVSTMHSVEEKQHLSPPNPDQRQLQSVSGNMMQFATRDNGSNPTHYQKMAEPNTGADDHCHDTLQRALMLSDVIDELQPATPQQMGTGDMLSPGGGNKPPSVISGGGVGVLCLPSNSHSMPQGSMSTPLSSLSSNRPLPPDFNPLYPNTFRADTPGNQMDEHSRTIVHEHSPRNLMHDHSPRHIVHDQSPRNIVHDQSPRNIVHDQSPRNMMLDHSPRTMMRDQSPRNMMHDHSPRNNMRDQSPRNLVHEQSPRNITQDQSPRNVVHEHSPRNINHESFINPANVYHDKMGENFSESSNPNLYGDMHVAIPSNRKPRETKAKRGFVGKAVNAEPPMVMPQPQPTKVIGSANPIGAMHEAFDNQLLEAHQGERKSSLSSLTEYRIERSNKSAFSSKTPHIEPKKAHLPHKPPVFSPPSQQLEAPTAHSKKKSEFPAYGPMRPVLAHNRGSHPSLYRHMDMRPQGQYPGYPFEAFAPPHLVSQHQQYSQLYGPGPGVPQGDLRSHSTTSQSSMMSSQPLISQSSMQPHNYKTMCSNDRASSPSQHPVYPSVTPHPAYPSNRFQSSHPDYALHANMPPIPPAHSGYPSSFQHIMAPKPDHMTGLRHNMADQNALSAMNPFQHNVFPQQQQYNKPSVSVESHASASSSTSPQSKKSLPTECAVCKKEVSYLCARCLKEGYCSQKCQNVAWATHGYNCFPK